MQLAISNIAWPPEDADAVYETLSEYGVWGLEVAPSALFAGEPDPFEPSEQALRAAVARTSAAGLSLVSMQSLLFGVGDASLFGGAEGSAAFEAGMRRAVDLAARLGIGNLVVGSPKNRVIPDHISRAAAWGHAKRVFRRLGDYADARGCVFAMEPNPAIYGTNFLNSMAEACEFVRQTDHPAVTLNFDVGSIHINGEFDDLPRLLSDTIDKVSHVHVSQPQLAPITPDIETLSPLFEALRSAGWQGWVSIEMRKAPSGAVGEVRRALECCLATMAGH